MGSYRKNNTPQYHTYSIVAHTIVKEIELLNKNYHAAFFNNKNSSFLGSIVYGHNRTKRI